MYVFGFENGIPPEIAKQKKEDEAFERFLRKLLGEEAYKTRSQMRLIEEAVRTVVDEILENQI